MKYFKYILFISIIISLFSCKFFEYSSEAIQIQIKAEEFMVAWDSREYIVAGISPSISSYRVYYRPHNQSRWTLLEEIQNTGLCEYSITKGKLDYGIYDIAISSITTTGIESELHSSLDDTAEPVTGWYINWIGSK